MYERVFEVAGTMVIWCLWGVLYCTGGLNLTPEPSGKETPQVKLSAEVTCLLDQWEKKNEGVKSIRIVGKRDSYDEVFKIVTHFLIETDSSDETHWKITVSPVPLEKNAMMTVRNQKWPVRTIAMEQWSADGESFRHHDASSENEAFEGTFAADLNKSTFEEGMTHHHFFVGFTTEKFTKRFNIRRGELETYAGKPVHHLVFEPHAHGVDGDFLRFANKFEVILSVDTLQLLEFREMVNKSTTVATSIDLIELKK